MKIMKLLKKILFEVKWALIYVAVFAGIAAFLALFYFLGAVRFVIKL